MLARGLVWTGRIVGLVAGFTGGIVPTEWRRLPWVGGRGDGRVDALAQTVPFALALLGWIAGSYTGRRVSERSPAR